MSRYVIILSTIINAPIDLQHISQVMNTFSGISAWSVDLEDCDQILRVVCNADIGLELVKSLRSVGISSLILEVFDNNGISVL